MEESKNKIKSFTDLFAWQKGHELVVTIYEKTDKFPNKEIFGLTNQMRRAAISITSNIAEGFSRNTSKDKYQFYSIAQGSLTELQNQLLISRDVGYLSKELFEELMEQTIIVNKLIYGLKRIKYSKEY
ncbi:MAG: four helix bundle protein [Candidatus Portnoybacteria bacterium]|jgi:four helix bundle protein|nr:four helix bundle protein [Candidatus Portnoybacteria bacterium]